MKLYKMHAKKPASIEVRDLREKFFLVDDEYLNGWAALLGPKASMVYMLLCRHANREQSCFPSVTRIGEKLGMRRSTAILALRMLERYKIITIERRMGRQSIYWLNSKTNWKKQKEGELARPDSFQ